MSILFKGTVKPSIEEIVDVIEVIQSRKLHDSSIDTRQNGKVSFMQRTYTISFYDNTSCYYIHMIRTSCLFFKMHIYDDKHIFQQLTV